MPANSASCPSPFQLCEMLHSFPTGSEWDRGKARGINNADMGSAQGHFRPGPQAAGKLSDGGGLMLPARRPGRGRRHKAWLFRYQIDHRERVMGLGRARVVVLAEARAKANEAGSSWRPESIRSPTVTPNAWPPLPPSCTRHVQGVPRRIPDSHGDRWRKKHRTQWRNSMATYGRPLLRSRSAILTPPWIIKVIEPEWKRAPTTMDRVRNRIGEVLAFAEVRGLRQAGPAADAVEEPSRQAVAASALVEAGRASCGDDLRGGAAPVSTS